MRRRCLNIQILRFLFRIVCQAIEGGLSEVTIRSQPLQAGRREGNGRETHADVVGAGGKIARV
jgi:hypothetical protein